MQVINFKLLEKKILNKLNSPIVESMIMQLTCMI